MDWVIWLDLETGVVGDSSSLSSLSTGSSGMACGRSSPRGPLTGVFLPPTPPSSSLEMANRGISMIAEQQRRRTVSGGLESLSVWEDSETDRRFLRLKESRHIHFSMIDNHNRQKQLVIFQSFLLRNHALNIWLFFIFFIFQNHNNSLISLNTIITNPPRIIKKNQEHHSHFRRAHQPTSIPGLQATETINPLSSLFA